MDERVRDSVRGLALGDAFGEMWLRQPAATVEQALEERQVAVGRWLWTDDTAMALALVRHLHLHGEVVQDELAAGFAGCYHAEPSRGYGPSMHRVLRALYDGQPWAHVTTSQFGGQGSHGNGAAMRVAPLGAWFAGDLVRVQEQARAQALVTHAHPEGVAGAVAVAVAAALSVAGVPGEALVAEVARHTPEGDVASALRRAARLRPTLDPRYAAAELGCGQRLSAPDTVPYAVWCAARHLDDLTEALWATAWAGGDSDTTCAIVGGIVAGRTGLSGVPAQWLTACEPVPA